jgi:hypothetical protein
MSRLFTFGCSFTNYRWSTWADILGAQYQEYQNWAQAGAGNHFIFNSVMEADQRQSFGPGDTVMVCWTNVMREDRYITNSWVTLGNIMTTPIFTKEFITDAVSVRGNLIRDLAFIKSVHDLLKSRKGVVWRFISMCPMLQLDPWETTCYQDQDVVAVYQNILDSILPSFTEVLGHEYWHRNKEKRFSYAEGKVDYHPTPEEHLAYLDTVLPGWVTNQEIRVKILEESVNLSKDPRRSGMSKVTRL